MFLTACGKQKQNDRNKSMSDPVTFLVAYNPNNLKSYIEQC